MNCKEFWEKWTSGENVEFNPELKTHITSCHNCNKELSFLIKGVFELKKEIFDEEPASFWHGMKDEIHKNVKIPKKRKRVSVWLWKKLWLIAPIFIVLLFFLFFTTRSQLMFNSEDIYLLAGGIPDSAASININQEFEEESIENEKIDGDLFIGISDPMAALLNETS